MTGFKLWGLEANVFVPPQPPHPPQYVAQGFIDTWPEETGRVMGSFPFQLAEGTN